MLISILLSIATCWTILSRVLPHGKQYPPEYCHMLNNIVYNFYYSWSFIHAREVRTRGSNFLHWTRCWKGHNFMSQFWWVSVCSLCHTQFSESCVSTLLALMRASVGPLPLCVFCLSVCLCIYCLVYLYHNVFLWDCVSVYPPFACLSIQQVNHPFF